MESLVGRTLQGAIHVREKIGDTVHGAVYRAEDGQTGLELELLTLPYVSSWSQYHGEATEIDQLWDQLSRARRINHPNIANVKALGFAGERTRFVAVEVIRGELLSDILQSRGGLSPKEATELIRQAAWGLHAAHAEAVLHGGISPETILVTVTSDHHPCAKLVRFGLPLRSSYSPPEHLAGSSAGPRGDIYSLGAVLYRALTGEPPDADLRKSEHIQEPLRSIVLKALDPVPARRFATAGALAEALEIGQEDMTGARRQHASGRWIRLAAVAALFVAVSGLAWLLMSPGNPLSDVRAKLGATIHAAVPQPVMESRSHDSIPKSKPGSPRSRSGAEARAGGRAPRGAGVRRTAPTARQEKPIASPSPLPGDDVADSAQGYAPEPIGPSTSVGAPSPPPRVEEPVAEPVTEEKAPPNPTPALQLALGDLTRLGIIVDYRQVRPGHLALTVGEGYRTSTSLEYNLTRLYAAYLQYLGYPNERPMVELWENGVRLGKVTDGGLEGAIEPTSPGARDKTR